MLPSQKKLLELLQKKAMSSEELVKRTGLSPDGIRGRLSETRKLGYEITKINGIYHLTVSDKMKHVEQILKFVEQHHLSKQKIPVNVLQDKLKISHEELTDALIELYHQNRLLQISNKIVVIHI